MTDNTETLSVDELAALLIGNIDGMENASSADKFAFGMELAAILAVAFAQYGERVGRIPYERTSHNMLVSMENSREHDMSKHLTLDMRMKMQKAYENDRPVHATAEMLKRTLSAYSLKRGGGSND